MGSSDLDMPVKKSRLNRKKEVIFGMKKLNLILAVMVSAVLFCGPVQAGEKNVLTVAQVADAKILDPIKAQDVYTANAMRQIYNNLVKMNTKMEIQPDLAESWENPDTKTWIFHLRKGVKFHNGEELTAKDVKFSIERILDPKAASPGKRLVNEVEDITVVDPYTLKIVTKSSFAPLLTNLTRYEMAIVNEKAVTEAGDDYANHPVGTGPFMFKEHHNGDKVTLDRFDGYFEGPAKIAQVVYRAIPEDATRAIELESGGVDISCNFPPQEFDRISKDDRFVPIDALFQATTYVGINTKIKPFDNKLVRQAINYAVDKDAIIAAVFFGRGTPSYGPLSPSIWGFDESLKHVYPYDPEKAKKLLKEAGFANGFECIIWTDPRTERKSVVEMVQAYLSQVGISARIEIFEWGKFLAETRKGAKGLFVLGWTGTGDADGGLYARFHSSGIGQHNRSQWANAELDALLEAGRTTIDQAKRKEIYKKAQAIIIEEAPDLFIGISKNLAVLRKGVKGFELMPNNINPLYDVSLAD